MRRSAKAHSSGSKTAVHIVHTLQLDSSAANFGISKMTCVFICKQIAAWDLGAYIF